MFFLLPFPEGFQADFCCSFKPDDAACEPQCGRTPSSLPPTAKAAGRDRADAGGAAPASPAPLHPVPNHVVVSAEGSIARKTGCPGRALPRDRAGQPRAAEGKAGRRDPAQGSEGAPGPEGPRRTAARPDHGPEGILGDSRSEMPGSNSFQDKARRHPPRDAEVLPTDVMKGSGEPQPDPQRPRSLETPFQSLLELKKAARPAPSDPARGAAELRFPAFAAAASQDSCLQKLVPDHSDGAVETDSLLEAAVNSILEC